MLVEIGRRSRRGGMVGTKRRWRLGLGSTIASVLSISLSVVAPVVAQDGDPWVAIEGEDQATVTSIQERRTLQGSGVATFYGEITIGMQVGGALERDGFRVLNHRVLDARAGEESLIRDDDSRHHTVRMIQGQQENEGRNLTMMLDAPTERTGKIDRLEVSVIVAPPSATYSVDLGVVAGQECEKPLATETLAEFGIEIQFDHGGNESTTLRFQVDDPQGCLLDVQGLKPDGTLIDHQSIHIHPQHGHAGEGRFLWFVFLNHHRGQTFDPETDGLRLTVIDPSAVEDREFFFEDLPLP